MKGISIQMDLDDRYHPGINLEGNTWSERKREKKGKREREWKNKGSEDQDNERKGGVSLISCWFFVCLCQFFSLHCYSCVQKIGRRRPSESWWEWVSVLNLPVPNLITTFPQLVNVPIFWHTQWFSDSLNRTKNIQWLFTDSVDITIRLEDIE